MTYKNTRLCCFLLHCSYPSELCLADIFWFVTVKYNGQSSVAIDNLRLYSGIGGLIRPCGKNYLHSLCVQLLQEQVDQYNESVAEKE